MHRHNHKLAIPRSPSLPVLALVLTIAIALLCVSGCGESSGSSASASKIEKQTVPLVLRQNKDEEAKESEIDLYFVDGGDVPYVEVTEFMPLFGGLYENVSISGTMQISSIKNGSFYNADTGIEPDVPITKFDTYFDREQLVDFIHSLK